MRFIADAMLGRLARWLRLLGFDTLYCPDLDDAGLLKLARKERRLILTRDTRMGKRDVADRLLIESDNVMEQAAQVIRELGLRLPGEGRCARCNGELELVGERAEVRDSVPEHVYRNFSRFHRCARCGNIYWEGSQYRRLMEAVEGLKKDARIV
jgi:uncharacterized protein with PIN domain